MPSPLPLICIHQNLFNVLNSNSFRICWNPLHQERFNGRVKDISPDHFADICAFFQSKLVNEKNVLAGQVKKLMRDVAKVNSAILA